MVPSKVAFRDPTTPARMYFFVNKKKPPLRLLYDVVTLQSLYWHEWRYVCDAWLRLGKRLHDVWRRVSDVRLCDRAVPTAMTR